jgi:hypothetical protein
MTLEEAICKRYATKNKDKYDCLLYEGNSYEALLTVFSNGQPYAGFYTNATEEQINELFKDDPLQPHIDHIRYDSVLGSIFMNNKWNRYTGKIEIHFKEEI